MLLSEITLPEVLAGMCLPILQCSGFYSFHLIDESASLRDSSPDILTLKSRVTNNRDVLLKEEEKEVKTKTYLLMFL